MSRIRKLHELICNFIKGRDGVMYVEYRGGREWVREYIDYLKFKNGNAEWKNEKS